MSDGWQGHFIAWLNKTQSPTATTPHASSESPARLRLSLSALLHRWEIPEDAVIIGSALVVGGGTGLSAVLFQWTTLLVRDLTLRATEVVGVVAGVMACMVAAGLVVGLIVRYWAPEVRGSGVPEVMEAVAIRGGRIRRRVAAAKIIATSITVGSGGSAGREGPIVLVGSAIGSTVGQSLRFSEERVRTLAACGAAGGIAAVFNAPIAGALFAMEVILGRFTVRYFGAVVISAVAASIVSESFLGRMPAFEIHLPVYPLYHFGEIPIYAVLGVLAAAVAVLFTRVRFGVEGVFARWRVPLPAKAAVGMAVAAALGLLYPEYGILGSGLPALGRAIADNIEFSVGLMAILLALKIIATSFTVGSGNSGGIFAPSLYIGAILGGIVGTVANGLWPEVAPNPGAYAIVGMAAVFSGAARAPIASVLIVFEMTGDYQLILPLMLATVIATLLAEHLFAESMYTMTLKLRGIALERGLDVDIMEGVIVEEVMSRDFDNVDMETTLDDLSDLFSQTHRHGFPILDHNGKLCGVVSISDLDKAIQDHVPLDTPAQKIGTPRSELVVVTPNDSMRDALARMGTRGLGRIPVVDPGDSDHLLGLVRRSDITRAYELALSRRADLQQRAKRQALRDIDGTVFSEITLHHADNAVGKRVSQLSPGFPKQCILVSVRRSGKLLIPHGDTVFQAGDRVTVFVNAHDVDAVHDCLRQGLAGAQVAKS